MNDYFKPDVEVHKLSMMNQEYLLALLITEIRGLRSDLFNMAADWKFDPSKITSSYLHTDKPMEPIIDAHTALKLTNPELFNIGVEAPEMCYHTEGLPQAEIAPALPEDFEYKDHDANLHRVPVADGTEIDVIKRDGRKETMIIGINNKCWFANNLSNPHPGDIMKWRMHTS